MVGRMEDVWLGDWVSGAYKSVQKEGVILERIIDSMNKRRRESCEQVHHVRLCFGLFEVVLVVFSGAWGRTKVVGSKYGKEGPTHEVRGGHLSSRSSGGPPAVV